MNSNSAEWQATYKAELAKAKARRQAGAMRPDEQEWITKQMDEAKTVSTDRLVKTLASMRRNLGANEMICMSKGVYTTAEGRAAFFAAIEAEIASRT